MYILEWGIYNYVRPWISHNIRYVRIHNLLFRLLVKVTFINQDLGSETTLVCALVSGCLLIEETVK